MALSVACVSLLMGACWSVRTVRGAVITCVAVIYIHGFVVQAVLPEGTSLALRLLFTGSERLTLLAGRVLMADDTQLVTNASRFRHLLADIVVRVGCVVWFVLRVVGLTVVR